MRIVRVDRFVEEEERVEWLIGDLLANVGWTLLYGERGCGKTTFAMQLCDALQSGVPFIGRTTLQTPTLYIQADSVDAEWREILKRIAPKSSAFTVVSVPDRALDNPLYVQAIKAWIDKYKPGFVVFDSYYNLTHVQINTTAALLPINIIKAMLGPAIPWLMVHHPTKAGDQYSGHNSLGGNCSNEWHLLRHKMLINKGRLVESKEIAMERDSKGLWRVPSDTDAPDELDGLTYVRI